MEREAIETLKIGDLTFRLFYDPDPMSPREWNNVWLLVSGAPKIAAMDLVYTEGLNFWFEDYKKEHPKAEVHKIWGYKHSGTLLSTEPYDDNWDSGLVGIAVRDPDAHPELTPEDALDTLGAELDAYQKYINGEVYGYTIHRVVPCVACGYDHEDEVDSCWGFYSQEEAKDAWKNMTKHPCPVSP